MGKKLIALTVLIGAILVLVFKQYVYEILLGTDFDISRILKSSIIGIVFALIIAITFLFQKSGKTKEEEGDLSGTGPVRNTIFTISFAIGAFVFYLLLLIMRLVLFIDMYIVSPIMLMVEFTLITIVAIMLFVPFLVEKSGVPTSKKDNLVE